MTSTDVIVVIILIVNKICAWKVRWIASFPLAFLLIPLDRHINRY